MSGGILLGLGSIISWKHVLMESIGLELTTTNLAEIAKRMLRDREVSLKRLKGCCWIMRRHWDSWPPGGEEFNPGPETRLDRSELLCNKVLLKYKGDREGFLHRHQKGAEEYPWVLYSSGLLCVSSHYMILPKVTESLGLGVSAITPKAQGLISGQEWRFHKWFSYVIKWD